MRLTRSRRLVGLALGMLMVAGTVLAIAGPAEAVLIDGVCYGSGTSNKAGCTGKDPQEMGCSPDAVTQAWTSMETGIVELRYSAACHARWTRFTWGGAGAAYPATIWTENTSGSRYTKAVAGYAGEQVWTKMFSGNVTVRGAVNFYWIAGGTWWTNYTSWKP